MLGWTAERVRNTISTSELYEWSVYLNGPFSLRSRDILLNGWLVHNIRSIVATKRHRPKLRDSMFPFDKLAKDYFVQQVDGDGKKHTKAGKKLRTTGEVAHMTHMWRQRYEKALADYRAGRITNSHGLYVNERIGD